jgi:putative ABC transport system substrate-binding protein
LWAEPAALLYPDVRDPYLQVFLNIAKGAESELGQTLKHQVVEENTSSTDIQNWLQKHRVSSVVALGSHTADLLGSNTKLPFVVGAINAQAPNTFSSISLNPAPNLLFAGVRELKPKISTIHVVFDPARNGWEIEQATSLAEAMGMTLLSYPVDDLRQAANTFRDIQSKLQADTEALWLPLGGPARDKTIMQNILETAWIHDQVVFSSNLADVKRGALFAMYPDNIGMGGDLGKLLKSVQENPEREATTQFASSLFKAVNRRTAEHLEIGLSNQALSRYEFVYPPR